jgi:outer membrane lipoprotein carrier protein
MKKLYSILAVLLSSVLVVSAQKSDPEAKKVLDAVSAKFKSFKSVQASFAYKVEDARGKVQASKTGTLVMKGTKYKVTFVGQEIFCDGKTVWNYDKSAKEVTINNVEASGSTISPQKLFTNFYDKDFLYMLNGEKKVGARTIQEIELTPTDKSKNFHKVYVQVDKNAKTIYSMRVLENGGNRYTYTINSMKTDAAVNDAQFVFQKSQYPGVEEVDLR